MSDPKLTLDTVLEYRPAGLPAAGWARVEAGEHAAELGLALDGAKVPGGWGALRETVLTEAAGLLDVSLLDVFRWGWNKSRELERYRDRAKYPPHETFTVPLAEHTIKSSHKPHVEIRIDGAKKGRIDFAVEIEIAVKGMKLEVQGARIRKIRTGECKAKGTFSCEGLKLVERESRTLSLPGTLDLGEGIEI
jgi:hypothetical protein